MNKENNTNHHEEPKSGVIDDSLGLFARVACLRRLPRRILRRLLVMTIPTLALVFSLNLSTTWAAKCVSDGSTSGGIIEGTGATCVSCGKNCNWELDNGKLSITAATNSTTGKPYKNVVMNDYTCMGDNCSTTAGNRPWESQLLQIQNIFIGDNIIKIGNDAFQAAHNLQSVTGMKDVQIIGNRGDNGGTLGWTGLTSFTVPDSVTYIGKSSFIGASSLTELIIPDSLANSGVTLHNSMFTSSCFNPSYASINSSCADAKIICQGDVQKCKTALAKFGGNGTCTAPVCINPDAIVAADYKYCTGNYFWNGAECVREPDVSKRTCCTGCKDLGGWCNRVRYTPAEAAAIASDSNTNIVTITFRK